jgi:DNA-binding NarL/FixJ family response regulator
MPRLTRRQREVFVFILLGLTTKDMAKRLSIGVRTIDDHRREVLKAFGVNSTEKLLRIIW